MAKTNEAWSPTINGLDYLVRNIGDCVVCRWVVNTRPRYAKMSTMAKNHPVSYTHLTLPTILLV